MTPDRWTRVADLFDRAADLAPADRPAFLDAHAVGPDGETDGALREEVERLLAFDAAPAGFLDGAPLAPPEAAPPEAGPWRLSERVGRGGMGEVWRADRPIGDDGLRQTAAVKLVRPGLGDDVAVRFRAERRILAGLDHPAIARLLGGGTASDGRPFLATEFVDGEPITAYADRRRLGVNERLALFVEVCEAVAYAHARLVVHRDLKPSNVLVTDDSRVKLLDFGIAKLLDDDGGLHTRTGRPVLTPAYAAPEQAAGGVVTTATDVYGLGVLLYELLVGARPAPGGDATRPSDAVTTAGETGGRVPPRPAPPVGEGGAAGGGVVPDTGALRSTTAERLRRRLRGDLDRICLKALRADPERRYRGAAELGADVRRHLDGLPVEARPESRAYRAGKFVRRNRAPVAAAAVALIAVVGGAGAALWQAAEAGAQRDLASAEAEARAVATGVLSGAFAAARPGVPGADTLRAATLLDGLLATVDTLSDARARGLLSSTLADEYLSRGDFAVAERLAAQAVAAPAPPLRSVLEIRANDYVTLGTARIMLNREAEAIAPLRAAARLSESLWGRRDYRMAYVLAEIGRAQGESGDPAAGAATLAEAAALARSLDEDPTAVPVGNLPLWLAPRSYAGLGTQLIALGRMDEAAAALDTALTLAQRRGTPNVAAAASRYRAELAVQEGDPAYGLELVEAAIPAMVDQMGPTHFVVWYLREIRGVARAALGDPRGTAELREVLAWAEDQHGPDAQALAPTLRRLSDALADTDPDESRRLIERAFEVSGGAVTDVQTALMAVRLAEALARDGELERARRLASAAQAVFEGVGNRTAAARASAVVRS